MKQSALAALLFSVFALAMLCSGQDAAQPYQIKNDVLGESKAIFQQNHQDEKVNCPNVKGGLPGLEFCVTLYQPLTYAGDRAESRNAYFLDDRLYKVSYLFNPSAIGNNEYGFYYERLLQPLTEKFGKPTEIKDSDFANLTGANLKNQVATWKNGISTIQLEKYLGTDPHTTGLTFLLDKLAEDAAQRQYKARHAKSDM